MILYRLYLTPGERETLEIWVKKGKSSAKKVTWVMDNFSTHKLSFFYEHFPPAQAKAYIDRMEIIYTPVHASVAEYGGICNCKKKSILSTFPPPPGHPRIPLDILFPV